MECNGLQDYVKENHIRGNKCQNWNSFFPYEEHKTIMGVSLARSYYPL